MNSIIQTEPTKCYLCGKNGSAVPLETHHIFFGSNRHHSEEDGMTVRLCGECHRNAPWAVHRCRDVDIVLKQMAQETWERTYGTREDFRKRYGKSYIEE